MVVTGAEVAAVVVVAGVEMPSVAVAEVVVVGTVDGWTPLYCYLFCCCYSLYREMNLFL